MSIWNLAWNWNTTSDEEKEIFPCDQYMTSDYRSMMRAIDILTSAAIVFRWICQLKVAPYSYDWIDNLGRQSPRQLTPGVDQLEIGQNFLIGKIVEFEEGRHITSVIHQKLTSIFGFISLTYAVKDTGPEACRLIVKVNCGARNWIERLRRFILAWGDLIMMRKQLNTIKSLAESNSSCD
ncbi:MAG: hypothetical protein AB1649_31000 [Chloroflexota bacterium]